MTTTISLLRHGEVLNPKKVLYGRLPHFPLSVTGVRQADAAAKVLASTPLTALYSSPMQRAYETAQRILHQFPHLNIEIADALNEIYTPYEGKPLYELEQIDWEFYSDVKPPYEQPFDIITRIKKFFMMVKHKHIGQHIAAVTHGDIVAFSILWAQGSPVNGEAKRQLAMTAGYPATASITTFTLDNSDRPLYLSYLKPY